MLYLIAILEDLLEDPELIPDAIAHRRDVEGRQRVEQAGGQPAQAPVPQPRLHVKSLKGIGGNTADGKRLAGQVGGAGVDRVLPELTPQHVLRRQVVDELRVGRIMRLGRPGPAIRRPVTDGDSQCPVGVMSAGRLDRRPPVVIQVVNQVLLELGQRVAHPPGTQSASYGHAPNLTLSVRRRQSPA
jgi:hypothetical protein